MKKYTRYVVSACLAVSILFAAALQANAQSEKKERPLPFHGTIDSVDTTGKTVTLVGKESKRVFHVSSETRMVKQGKPATLADAKAGEVIGGSYTKDAAGKLHAVSLRFGPKPENEAKDDES